MFQNGNKLGLNPHDPTQTTTLETGAVSLNFSNEPIQQIALADYPKDDTMKPSFFVGVAEASVIPTDSIMIDFKRAQERIQRARSLRDMEDVTTANYIQPLKDKVGVGVNELMVVSMLQNLRPDNVNIQDVRGQKDHSKLAVTGNSSYGKVHGVVEMVQDPNGWKIERETWFSDQKKQVAVEKNLLTTMNVPPKLEDPMVNSSLAFVENPDVKFNRNTLNLQMAHPNISKKNFTFIYYIQKKDRMKEHLTGTKEELAAPVHILWTGPRSMVPQQTVVKNEYPINYSIADDNDGYMPGAMNLHLPKRKPNGVVVSAMFTF